MSREAAYQALFNALSTLKTGGLVKIAERRVQLIDDVAPTSLPALFMGTADQEVKTQSRMPAKRTLGAEVFLYAANPDKHTAAGIVLNGLIDAVEAALAPAPGQDQQTLGGVVTHAWIEGTIKVFDGPLGQRAAAIVPVKMLVP